MNEESYTKEEFPDEVFINRTYQSSRDSGMNEDYINAEPSLEKSADLNLYRDMVGVYKLVRVLKISREVNAKIILPRTP